MGCAPGMRGCRVACLHKQLVQEYRDARAAYEYAMETETALYPAEVAEFKESMPGPTFKD